MVAAQTRIAYAQVDSFIEMLDDMYINMIPRKLRYFFKQEKDINYNKPVVPDIPIKNQNLTREALALIAFLNLNYWCKDKDEKDRLIEIYKKNDEKYNQEQALIQQGKDINEKSNYVKPKLRYWMQEPIDNLDHDEVLDDNKGKGGIMSIFKSKK